MSNKVSILQSIKQIEKHIAEKLTVEQIAHSVYFSKFHYQRVFREIVGESVMEYVNKRRLTLAGKALLGTNKTILEIALTYGFSSHEGFTRSFKSFMGITPTEYRKFGLSAISQNFVKEQINMTYSKNTRNIIRELNEFIARAKQTAELARKQIVNEYLPFWDIIADRTDDLANKLTNTMTQITAIADYPDAISNRISIIKLIEDAAFEINLLSFNANLMVSRGQPEHIEAHKNICTQYANLARSSNIKSSKIVELFNELASLIFADMRKKATTIIDKLIKSCKKVVDDIQGYSYISNEISIILSELSVIPIDEITADTLESIMFRLNIIAFAADIDTYRYPDSKQTFSGLNVLKNEFSEAIDFWSTIVMQGSTADDSPITRTTSKFLQDVTFQGNILLFYTKGEISDEKLGKLLTNEQKVSFENICEKIQTFISFTISSTDMTAYRQIADMLTAIHTDMAAQADELSEKGGAVRFLASEFLNLSNLVINN